MVKEVAAAAKKDKSADQSAEKYVKIESSIDPSQTPEFFEDG
jgi:hypothetical protein